MQRTQDFHSSTTAPRFASIHNTSSAFSASANPNEDWTKISDLAERRRIQNRIAQRNYRKKIKKRLEDLERRASSPEGSPEQIHLDLPTSHRASQRCESMVKRPKSKSGKQAPPNRNLSPRHAAPHHTHDFDDSPSLFPLQPLKDCSTSPPPPQLSYAYSLAEPTTYAQNSAFQPLSSCYADYPGHSYYLPPLPTTLPSMPSYELEPMKAEARYEDDGMLNQFNSHVPYASYGSSEMPQSQQYQDSNLHTPPLSHSQSFEYVRDTSGSPSLFPGTPVSGSISPRLIIR